MPSGTVAGLLADLDRPGPGGGFAPASVLVVDEAGMVGTRALARLCDHAARADAKVVLIGDPTSCPRSTPAGRCAPSPRASTHCPRRQPPATAAVGTRRARELRDGDPAVVLAAYTRNGRVIPGPSGEAARDRLVADWWAARTADTAGVMIAVRCCDVDDLNQRARAHLAAAGELTGPTLTTTPRCRELREHNDAVTSVRDGPDRSDRPMIDARLDAHRLMTILDGAPGGSAEALAAAARPGVRFATQLIQRDEELRVGASRFGGLPDLAPSCEWPSWRRPCGSEPRPLAFLAQIRLDGVVQATDLPLPLTGLLSFFADVTTDGAVAAAGLLRDEHEAARLVWQPTDRLEPRAAPLGTGAFPPALLQPIAVTTIPDPARLELDDAAYELLDRLDRAVEEHVAEALPAGWALGGRHQLGGHARSIQHPVEEEALQAAAAVTGRDGGFDEARWRAVASQLPEWRLLLQLDSDRHVGVIWGDMGTLYWIAREAALAASAWDEVWFVFQSW